MEIQKKTADFISFINSATSPFHVVKESAARLADAGFTELDLTTPWSLLPGGSYYVNTFDSGLIAFTIPKNLTDNTFRIAAAHTDHPCLKIKPSAEITEGNYLKINTGIYGGPILNTWLDRPLSIAGKVSLKSNDIFRPQVRLVDFERAVLTIPNLAIHMNQQVNKGIELNKQVDMLPLAGLAGEDIAKKEFFLKFLAKELSVSPSDILDFDLYVYNQEKAQHIGMENDFISAPRLDNLTSVYSCLGGIIRSRRSDGINIVALFDNEEVGNTTKQGAASNLLSMIMEKIYSSFSLSNDQLSQAIIKSFLLSVDVGHAIHPNKPEKNDPVMKDALNSGVLIKIDVNQKYAFDSEAIGAIMQLCMANQIPFQKYANRSDIVGGSTLGSVVSTRLPMKTIDIGVPLLAMHSARELMGAKDQESLDLLLRAFFE